MTALANYQAGFRLIDGSQLNKMVAQVNNLTGNGTAGPISGTTGSFTGALTLTGGSSLIQSSALTTLGNLWNSLQKLTLSATGITSGNGRGGRRELDLSGTVTGGAFIAGGQDKLIVTGTMNHADSRLMAGFSQLDGSAGVFTAGQVAAHWFDMGAAAPAGGWNTGGQSYVTRHVNTTASPVQAIQELYGKATYMLQCSDNGGGWVVAAAVAGNQNAKLKIQVNGTDYYIPLNTA